MEAYVALIKNADVFKSSPKSHTSAFDRAKWVRRIGQFDLDILHFEVTAHLNSDTD